MKIAIVTGASSGMGREYVHAIDREYSFDELWIAARREERLKELAAECRTPVRVLATDLSKPESVEALSALLASEKPEIGLLVNNAGYGLFGAAEELDAAEQLGIVDLNVRALTAVCLACLPYMKAGDSMINMGSNSAWQPVPYMAVYAAGKSYVLSFSRSLGRELKPRGIHVLCVCPGWIKTEFFDRAVRDDTVRYYDRWYTAEQVVKQAMKDLKKRKSVSICGFPVRFQAKFLVKLLPTDWVIDTWCRQQGKP